MHIIIRQLRTTCFIKKNGVEADEEALLFEKGCRIDKNMETFLFDATKSLILSYHQKNNLTESFPLTWLRTIFEKNGMCHALEGILACYDSDVLRATMLKAYLHFEIKNLTSSTL